MSADICVAGPFVGQVGVVPERGTRSAITKYRLQAAAYLGPLGFETDRQADRQGHGGLDRAVCLYPAEHYALWLEQFTGLDHLPVPSFGENLNSQGLLETHVSIGDIFRLGHALIQISQPRSPCWKLDDSLHTPGLAKALSLQHRTGWFYRVIESGEVPPEPHFTRVHRPHPEWTVSQVWGLCLGGEGDVEAAAELPTLAPVWRDRLRQRVSGHRIESNGHLEK